MSNRVTLPQRPEKAIRASKVLRLSAPNPSLVPTCAGSEESQVTAVMRLLLALLIGSLFCFAQSSEVVVRSNPSDAEVVINGTVVGRTPLTVPIRGVHLAFSLAVNKDGFAPWYVQSVSEPGQSVINAELQSLNVRPTPEVVFVGGTRNAVGSNSANSDTIPRQVGIYIVLDGNLVPVHSDVYEVRVAGLAQNMMTYGLKRIYFHGTVASVSSPLRFSGPLQFIVKAPEGFSIADTRLLRLETKKDHRDFRYLNVGKWYAANRDEIERNALPLTPETIDSSTWRIRLNADKGEYRFIGVPDGKGTEHAPDGRIKSLARIYTFGVD